MEEEHTTEPSAEAPAVAPGDTPEAPSAGPASADQLNPKILLAGAGAVAIGSFLPWATVNALGFSVSVSGTDGGDGWLTLIAAGILGFLGYLALSGGKVKATFMVIVSALLALLTAYEFVDVLGSGEEGLSVSIGVGLILIGIGAAAALVASIRLKMA